MAEPMGKPGSSDTTLESLRAEIDAIDHEVLRQLALRNGVVARIAAHKRMHGLPIRDREREGWIIADRRAGAEALGLRAQVVESVFRTVLAASRDMQASLRVGLSATDRPRSIAIIGGLGGMGRLFEGLLSGLGHTVRIADVNTELTPEQAAADADVTIVSVPMDATVDVIRRIGPRVRADGLLMDLTSIKTDPVKVMVECCPGSVVGLHPLFGPSIHTVQGQRVVMCGGRDDDRTRGWTAWARGSLAALGMTVVESTPEEHDRIMSVVQVLTHFATEVTGATLAALDIPVERTLEFTSPVYQMELYMTARHFAQSPDLYACIQMSNPRTPEVVEAFINAAMAQRRAVAEADRGAFSALFANVNAKLGPLSGRALTESGFLIDRLIERS